LHPRRTTTSSGRNVSQTKMAKNVSGQQLTKKKTIETSEI
jgi:hypothetical protein